MADQLLTTASTSWRSAPGREARHVALNRSHAELHSVALAPDHALGSQLDSDAVDFGCVRENVIHAARDGQQEMVAIVETAQGSMKATSGHGPSAVGDLQHCTAECGKATASSLAAGSPAAAQAKHTARVLLTECRARRHGLGFWFAFNAAQRARMRATATAPLPAPPRAPALPAQLDLFA
ncbi:hypothetical protein [Stenotrophomonas muris]|uniref:hypothetical protein n=1 Tax=Stenotrophomonas muris TaxID=2963283 RepID=UPI002E7A4E5E|nr:hypothetical protein [Stenotrophomonas muris]